MMEIIKIIEDKKLVPVVKLNRADDALPVAKALWDGGLSIAEVTFRTDAAEESIKIIRNKYPEMICGAGTVINVEQAKKAIDAGAAFIVSPGFSEEVVEYSIKREIPVIPGCCTPTEIMRAIDRGLSIVKFFPAKQFGGVEGIQALSAVFPGIRFLPTGGVDTSNLGSFLKNKQVIACGGSWMVTEKLILSENFCEITRLTEEAVKLVKSVICE